MQEENDWCIYDLNEIGLHSGSISASSLAWIHHVHVAIFAKLLKTAE